jgi:HTH-type transcriptional regulator/antitoxin HigA
MDIKPIKSMRDYKNALKEIESFFNAKFGTPEGDRLDVLTTLVEAYEAKQYPIDDPDPIEAINFVMEQQGLKRKDLEQYIGGRSRVAEVLNHKRALTLSMIRKLHRALGIPAEVLIRESESRV